jgi:hypothetical protein
VSARLPLTFTWRGQNQARVGDTVTLTLTGRVPPETTQMVLRVSADPARLKPIEATEGNAFRQGAGDITFTPGVDADAGQVMMEFQRANAAASLVTGVVATLRYEVVGEGRGTQVAVETVSAMSAAGEVNTSPSPPFTVNLNP